MPPNQVDEITYTVVMNDEEQYSIWSASRELPAGWKQVGVTGSKQECLSHIEEVWTDMRPASLRRAMEQDPTAYRGDAAAPACETGAAEVR